jgi:hypothetical protein
MAQTQPVNSTSLKLQYSGVLILPTKDGHAVGKDDCYYNACAKSFFDALESGGLLWRTIQYQEEDATSSIRVC